MSNLEDLLLQVKEGSVSIDNAKSQLLSYVDLGYAKIDYEREQRTGFPEVIYGEGKTTEQIIEILDKLRTRMKRILVTRVDSEKGKKIARTLEDVSYNEVAQTLLWLHKDEPEHKYEGYIAILCAGTSDLRVAEEAAITAEAFGCRVKRIYDVGVAGIHRLFSQLDVIKGATSTVIVAGMEGALPSVVGGLIDNPIIAVPTSVGYGASFNGLSALLTMLNSCAPGVTVVNIDNGFGAGYYSALLNYNFYKRVNSMGDNYENTVS
ncbi:nickel pincer cofactor biosynthesis protein LarB [Bacillus sp. T33-2]|uniref:nickel pincer cofactor biosynthesis protein LarB n=1 Tax=Bacillus sp. T33-2 TaxID=2054168 RepID=UPI001C6086E7|nr:nickel pincer cofactor biosynthesis protein LarB [Bacillus sp. T33-2]